MKSAKAARRPVPALHVSRLHLLVRERWAAEYPEELAKKLERAGPETMAYAVKFQLEYHHGQFRGRSLHRTKAEKRERHRARNCGRRDVLHPDRASYSVSDRIPREEQDADATLDVFQSLLRG